jgi:4-amino-4-deoxy-L-arabinose transferase-like glycosyltransferase
MSAVAAAPPRVRALSVPASALAAGAVTLLAGVLRLASLGAVAPNPFYDAAVRSMGTSWHAFLLGAFEPSGTVSIDKPPVDLWLQVASTKLLGFDGVALRLPEALASTLAVPLLYDTLRRAFGTTAGLAGALVLAVLPVAVLTGRSDTMDGVMGLLLVAALWCLVRAGETTHARWVLATAACVGLAFNVKLFEALVPLPALAYGAWLALRPTGRRRPMLAGAAAAVLVAVSLLWLTGTLFAAHPPYAIGSTNGSAWNAAFVFNGIDRIAGAPSEPVTTAVHAHVGHAAHVNPHHVHIAGPGPARLLARRGPLPAPRLGLLVLAALALGLPAIVAVRRRPQARVAAVTVGVWLVTGAVLYSAMSRLHPRYVESMSAAVAAGCGIGIARLAARARDGRAWPAVATVLALAAFATWAARGTAAAWIGLAAALAAVALVAAGWPARGPRRPAVLAALACAALVAAPAADAVHVVRLHLSDSGHPGAMPAGRVRRLSAYLRAHRSGARYEFASAAATQAGALIARDGQPALVLTSFAGRPLVSPSRLSRLAAAGDVRYVLLGGSCRTRRPTLAVCSPAATWVRRHGTDVSRAAGVYRGLLWHVLRPRSGTGARAG